MIGLLFRGVLEGRRLLNAHLGERGQGLVEYALILFLISVTVIIALGLVSGALDGVLRSVACTLGDAAACAAEEEG
jgi:Flp pilus assembly pilin Flp